MTNYIIGHMTELNPLTPTRQACPKSQPLNYMVDLFGDVLHPKATSGPNRSPHENHKNILITQKMQRFLEVPYQESKTETKFLTIYYGQEG